MKNISPEYVWNNCPILSEFIIEGIYYKLINKKEIPNLIMGYLTGSIIQTIKVLEFENSKLSYCSHNLSNPIYGSYIGKEYFKSEVWNHNIMVRYEEYLDNEYKEYLNSYQNDLKLYEEYLINEKSILSTTC